MYTTTRSISLDQKTKSYYFAVTTTAYKCPHGTDEQFFQLFQW
jgi:hypothetical protein